MGFATISNFWSSYLTTGTSGGISFYLDEFYFLGELFEDYLTGDCRF